MKKLVITDLDNTLYDWVSFYAESFGAMVNALSRELAVDRERLLDEFKSLHQARGDSEYPFAALELPSVVARFPGATRQELARRLDRPFREFNSVRHARLRLYDGVLDTLAWFADRGIVVVGHTEAMVVNAIYRLRHLKILPYFRRLYALEGHIDPHPSPDRQSLHIPPDGLVDVVPRSERKPNPRLLLDICARHEVSPKGACYVGDSLTRDISMAKEAGVTAVWARYGTSYDRRHWDTLVRITHWTPADVEREAVLRRRAAGVQPDHIIDAFGDLRRIVART